VGWESLSAVLTGFIAASVPLAKWLLSTWATKVKENDQLRARDIDSQIKQISTFAHNLKDTANILRTQLEDHTKRLRASELRMIQLEDRLDKVLEEVTDITRNLRVDINNQIRTEILKLKKETIMVRTKK